MGADVHCYIEYRRKNPRSEYERQWSDFGGRINPGRNYDLFAALAGVRGSQAAGLVPPRGIPDDLAWAAAGDYWLLIADDFGSPMDDGDGRVADPVLALMLAALANPGDEQPRMMLFDELQTRMEARADGKPYRGRLGPVTAADAARYHLHGARYKGEKNGKPVWVEHPDWHTATWLTAGEWERAIRAGGSADREEPEYFAILAALRGLEAAKMVARVVLWFDN